MASQSKAVAGIGGAVLLIAASFLGINLQQNSDSHSENTTTSTTASSTSAAASKSSANSKSSAKQSQTPTSAAQAKKQTTPGMRECPLVTLPSEAKPVIGAIKSGGPFDYPDNDGVHFGNFEQRLPKNNYLEYTVKTPGLWHRGERRIITGGGSKTNPDHWYYTEDHYESFCEIPDAQ